MTEDLYRDQCFRYIHSAVAGRHTKNHPRHNCSFLSNIVVTEQDLNISTICGY